MNWSALIGALLAGVVIWWLYRGVKANPESLSKENLGKSTRTMGILALILIAFVGVCIMLIRK